MYNSRQTYPVLKHHHQKKLFLGTLVIVAVLAVSAGLSYALQASNTVASKRARTALSPSQASSTYTLSPSPAVANKSNSSASTVAAATATTAVAKAASAIAPAAGSSTAASAPLKGLSLFSYAAGDVETAARTYASSHPASASVMNRLASQPMAQWYGEWNTDVSSATNAYVTAATAAGQVPVLVSYNIPNRDCGSYSAGGATSASSYTSWMQAFASGIGQRQAIVILEPDAIAGMDCLSKADQQARLQLISNAVNLLKANTAAKVYLDAGNPTWQSAATMQQRLSAAGIANADGFSLNISNFITTTDNINYGTRLSQQLGGAHFVIDTSRNGNGPSSDSQWCNPSGRAVGQSPSLTTGNALVDAYLWIKAPGASDGGCGPNEAGTGAPSAGVWWPEYALSLFQ